MTGRAGRPLVVAIEDDLRYVRQLHADLASCDFAMVVAGTGAGGLDLCASEQPDVVLLDLGLPDLDGLTVLRGVRSRCEATVVAMTARDDDEGVARALDAGADDYLPKPFGGIELLARLRSAMRHTSSTQAGAPPPFESSDLRIDCSAAEVSLAGQPLALRASEYRLLRFLAHNRDRVLTPAQLVEAVWGPEYAGDRHLARVYVRRLRQKIERNPGDPRILVTKPGVGYMLRRHG